MIIAGDVRLDDHYLIALQTTSREKRFYLFSTSSLLEPDNPEKRLLSYKDLRNIKRDEYLIGVCCISVLTGKTKAWGNYDTLQIVLDNLNYARTYTFPEASVEMHTKDITEFGESEFFSATDHNLSYSYKSLDGQLSEIHLVRGVLELDMVSFMCKMSVTGIDMKELVSSDHERVMLATLKTITLDDLDKALDMSWYHDGDKILKNYDNAKSVYELETKIITPIIKYAIETHKSGNPAIVSLDTETTGFNTINLSEDNPSRSHCVSIQLSWEEDQGVAIFNDMKYFSNVDISYTLLRLAELFEFYSGERTIEYWDTDDRITDEKNIIQDDLAVPHKINFDLTEDDSSIVSGRKHPVTEKSLNKFRKKSVTLTRDWFFLIGHNAPFDRRTCYQNANKTQDGIEKHVKLWFNADTLQMAFDLNPRTVRGSKALKPLTRKIFGHETPELSDILGKGNEDKFKYLSDEQVANIYGCADVDYTRKLFFFLRSLMSDSMWRRYLQQDVDLPNILAISEYYGMMTYPDKVLELAEQVKNNIEILKNAVYDYVGAFQEYTSERKLLENVYNSGMCTYDEYTQALQNIKVNPNATYRFDFKASSLIHVLYDILHYPIIAWTDGLVKKPKVDKYVMKKLVREKRKENSTARKLEKDILVYGADRVEYERLKNGSKGEQKKAQSMCLISADKFNKLEYPIALILQEYAALNKEYTSYYKPIIEENLEGKIFKNYNMARIETRRIANPGQTMKGNLKGLIRSYSDDYYILDFDMSQVEYRIMLSLSGYTEMVERMKNPERDYHTETAAMVNHIPAHKVTKVQRKKAKSVSFGVPYGLGDSSLCETSFGEVTQENLVATRIMLSEWKANNKPIMNLLESAREQALTEWNVSDEFRNFIDAWKRDKGTKEYILDDNGNKVPQPIGRVTNKLGFYRIFDLGSVGQTPADVKRRHDGSYTAEESSIRRMAGNYPVQSYAAEIFRLILTRFYWRCVKEGIEDKIIWHMLIHDELLCSVHKSLHPMYIYKLVKESCMITMHGHTSYFVGINIGDTWAECKDDAREAPIHFVERMINRWDNGDFIPEKTDPMFLKNGDVSQGYWFDHPWEFIRPLREQYISDRIGEVLRTLEDIDNKPIDVPRLLETFDNYTVRAYVNDYPTNGEVDKSLYAIKAAGKDVYDDYKYENAVWSSRLETWTIEEFGEGKEFIDSDGNTKILRKAQEEPIKKDIKEQHETDSILNMLADDSDEALEEAMESEISEEGYWSFDDEQLGMTFESEASIVQTEYDLADELDFLVAGAKSVSDLLKKEHSYKSFQLFNGQLRVNYDYDNQLDVLKKYFSQYACSTGYSVVLRGPLGNLVRWIKITDKVDLQKIDNELQQLLAAQERRLYANRI